MGEKDYKSLSSGMNRIKNILSVFVEVVASKFVGLENRINHLEDAKVSKSETDRIVKNRIAKLLDDRTKQLDEE